MAPRERFELPTVPPTAKELLTAIQGEAQDAIDAWMEGDTKAALTLLKELVFSDMSLIVSPSNKTGFQPVWGNTDSDF